MKSLLLSQATSNYLQEVARSPFLANELTHSPQREVEEFEQAVREAEVAEAEARRVAGEGDPALVVDVGPHLRSAKYQLGTGVNANSLSMFGYSLPNSRLDRQYLLCHVEERELPDMMSASEGGGW